MNLSITPVLLLQIIVALTAPTLVTTTPADQYAELDSTYHVIYNTMGNRRSGCEMLLYFYGKLLPVTASGDINGDGNVNVADILLAEQHRPHNYV